MSSLGVRLHQWYAGIEPNPEAGFMEISTASATRRLVVGGSMAAVVSSVATIILIPATVGGVLSSSFLPHIYCYLYDKKLIALHVGWTRRFGFPMFPSR